MSDIKVLICAPSLDADDAAEGLERLRSIAIPSAVKVVATTGKFDTGDDVARVNVEADYPMLPPFLMTMAAWAEMPARSEARFRDGYDLHCFQQALAKHHQVDWAVMLRTGSDFDKIWLELREQPAAPFVCFAGLNLALNLRSDPAFLSTLSQLYASGAAYALEPYSFDLALRTAWEAVQIASAVRAFRPSGPGLREDAPEARSDDQAAGVDSMAWAL